MAATILLLVILSAGIWFLSRDTDAPDVILVTIDTLRADRLGFAGDTRVETPFLDRIAGEGIVFENAHAHNVVTLPSHANILTGLLPYEHGVRDNATFVLDSQHVTLATRMRELGYATGAFIGAFPLDRRFGLDQGFDHYDDHFGEGEQNGITGGAERPASEVLEPAVQWWRKLAGKKRFMWIHIYDPHTPYDPPSPFSDDYADDPYRGEIASVDRALKQYLDPILGDGDRDLLLVITGDHGEALGEHGEMTHGLFAYEETLHVPLLISRRQSIEPRREHAYVGHIDLVPTILEEVGADIPVGLKGRNILRAHADADTYFESLSTSINRGWAPLVGIIHERHKYIELPIPELYDLEADPEEMENLYGADRRRTVRIRDLLEERSPAAEPNRNVSTEEKRSLLSLGYVTGAVATKDYTEEDDPKNLVQIDTILHHAISALQKGDRGRARAIAQDLLARFPEMKVAREIVDLTKPPPGGSGAEGMSIAELETAVREGSADFEMKKRLGMYYTFSGKPVESLALLRPLLGRDDVEVIFSYGVSLAAVQQFDEAERQFERVLELNPRDARAHTYLGVVGSRTGKLEMARNHAMRALEINPRQPLALSTLGVIRLKSGDRTGAIEAFRSSLEIDPGQHEILYNLAILAAQEGKFDLARQSLRRFIDSAPPERYAQKIDSARGMLSDLDRRGA